MRSSLIVCAAAASLGPQLGVDAFTNPAQSGRHTRTTCGRNVSLRSSKTDEAAIQSGAVEVDTAAAPIFLQNDNAQVVDTTGMPTSISLDSDNEEEQRYRNGLVTIGFITLLFASNSPALHSAFELTSTAPPVLLVNAAVTVVGLAGVVGLAPYLGEIVPDPSKKSETRMDAADASIPAQSNNMISRIAGQSTIAGAELGLWKTLGTTANIYGLSMTSSDHGAFLIQLTTLIVPAAQGLMGVPIPTRIWTAITLALGGVFMFTQDPSQADCASLTGDLLCALAAIFYATYDLRLFKWGRIVPTDELITTKMVTQSLLSFGLLSVLAREESTTFISQASHQDLQLVGAVSLWSGLAVNCLAPYLQVSGQQAVGPARAQILYASQPLWASMMSFVLLGEQFGAEGVIGGSAFLGAMFLAATAEMPDPNCPEKEDGIQCEV